ncbi:D-alanyl-D-alanine carboxypeptidase/D-alanyl-D-alanine endopeptidase [Legionella impletisoli]|uniref:D-alanyl-D-alanine carboxypeptidase n=1 Tax=Legionella impletisoli TaxID=343510 RepID=A0A917JLC7_9GAMM|nr:D-alanyl-D-alanine carboxypeptidase/D-alanyl-D-alanine-endopeptidase [Legionella impletisoli]GGI75246.1 D-alanyl-D-alanine carboxypeptidase [Legionella impletisoli]
MNIIALKRTVTKLSLVFLLLVTNFVYAASLKEDLDSLIAMELPQASVGVVIKDLGRGQTLYEQNPNKLLSPASGMKIFTAAASLYRLGPQFHYETSLLKDDRNIYVRFSGDPSLTKENLTQLIQSLKKHLIQTIAGNVVIDDSKFKPPYYAAGINYDDLGWYYVAPSSAVILNENKESFEFVSPKTIGHPVKIQSKNPNPPVKLINNLISVSHAKERNHCNFNIDIRPNNTLKLYGCLPQYKQVRHLALAIPEPSLYAKEVINEALKNSGIELQGKIIIGKTPGHATLIASHQSPELVKLVGHMLKESDNVYADSLTKLLGYSLTREGTYKQGAYAIKQIIAKHTTLDTKKMDISDGQGTRYNLITPYQMVTLLTDLYNDKSIWPYLSEALPRMGESGSLQARMKETDLEKKVLAKTGTMHDMSSLSGYVMTQSGKPLAFSIMINNVHLPIGKAKQLEEKMLLILSKHINGA